MFGKNANNSESQEEASKRHADFILLRSLEAKLPSAMFDQVVSQMGTSLELPKRMDWTGQLQNQSYDEIKVNSAQIDQNYLNRLVESQLNNFQQKKGTQYKFNLQSKDVESPLPSNVAHYNMYLRMRSIDSSNNHLQTMHDLKLQEVYRFERMKTVFGHAQIEEGYNAPVYNVKFDQTGQFIISGADDGIIKIWDKDTMNLQASLHSHMEVIADLDVSFCNRYLVSSSQDGKIIVWDWKNCSKVDTITDHTANVNNVKFFKISPNKDDHPYTKDQSILDEIQMLVSCSEDGTIRIYDEVTYLDSKLSNCQNNDQRQNLRRLSKGRTVEQKRFQLILTPDDYREGARNNKKIFTVNVSKDGIVVAGSDKGDVYLWQLDISCLKKQRESNAVRFVGSYKKHSKTVYFCEFSPDGKMLFTGSDDGTAKIWKIDEKVPTLGDEKLIETLEQKFNPTKEDKNTFIRGQNGELVSLASHKEKKNSWQCDGLVWSVHGRYVFAAFSGKLSDDKNHSVIKVWDSLTRETIHDLARGNNIKLIGFTFLLAPHPKLENIIMTGSDGGTICLWNVQTRQLLRNFLEYGAYSFEKLLMNDPQNGKFSPDGSSFVVGSEMGTLSLFSCDGGQSRYNATRVEQFLQFDNEKHDRNIYYEDAAMTEPQVSGYSLIPYEVQPPSSLLGRFRNARVLTLEEYERNLNIRQELAKDEENFIQHQLEEGKVDANFGARDYAQPIYQIEIESEGEIEVRRRQGRQALNSQESDQNQQPARARRQVQDRQPRRINPMQRQNPQQDIPRANLRMIINPNIDPDNDLYDRESDENFEEVFTEMVEDEDESMQSVDSESLENFPTVRRNARNYRNVDVIEEDVERENGRSTRLNRRNQEERKGMRRRIQSNESEGSAESDSEDEDAYGMSDLNEGRNTRRRTRNGNAQGSKQRIRNLPSSDDESIDTNMLNEDESDFGGGRRTRNRNKEASRSRGRSSNNRREEERGRNLRNRKRNVNYRENDDTYGHDQDDDEEEKLDGRGSKRTRQVVDESENDEMLDYHQHIQDFSKKLRGDEDYELVTSLQRPQDGEIQCEFCQRSDGCFIGPFKNVKQPSQSGVYYFHQDCLEANNHSFYNLSKQKWMNIGKALEVNERSPSMCDRCGKVGATITCQSCRKTYHGYYCSTLYLISMGQPRQYQCFECRNRFNYNNITENSIEKQEAKQMRKAAPRDHLLRINEKYDDWYLPQIDDQVYYFFQGHEKFIHAYNCFFYCGDTKDLSFKYPWQQYPEILDQPTLCRVVKVDVRFPSNRCLYLLKKYGEDSEAPQTPQLLIRVELMISNDANDDEKLFTVEFFPQKYVDEFLVLKEIFEDSMNHYHQLNRSNKLINETFARKGDRDKLKVVNIINFEGSVHPNTNWKILKCINLSEMQRRRASQGNRRVANDPGEEVIEFVNVWNIEINPNQTHIFEVLGLESRVKEEICRIILEVTEKKGTLSEPFMDRVPVHIAKDYRRIIGNEMWFNLITQRLLENYYRSGDQIVKDIDQILENCVEYNTLENELSTQCRRIVNDIKKNLKSILENQNIIQPPAVENQAIQNAPFLSGSMNNSSTKISIPLKFNEQAKHNQNRVNNSGPQLLSDRKQLEKDLDAFPMRQYEEHKQTIPSLQFSMSALPGKSSAILPGEMIQPGGRRSTRNASTVIPQQETSIDNSNSKSRLRRNATNTNNKATEESNLIGKTTRSGRNIRTQKMNLREESESEYGFEQYGEEDESEEPIQSKKRVRRI